MRKTAKDQSSEKMDPATQAALEQGLRQADADTQRWTSEEVKADARKMVKEWRKKINSA